MKVIGFKTITDESAPPGRQIAHYAVLECGHYVRVEHGDSRKVMTCPTCEGDPHATPA